MEDQSHIAPSILAASKGAGKDWLISRPGTPVSYMSGELLTKWIRTFPPSARRTMRFSWGHRGLIVCADGGSVLRLTEVKGPCPRPKWRGPVPGTLAARPEEDRRDRSWREAREYLQQTAKAWDDIVKINS